jgi:HlyD family secretion protein
MTFLRPFDRSNRNGISAFPVILVFVVLLSGAAIAFFSMRSMGKKTLAQPLVAPVNLTRFVSEVLDQGEIESSVNTEFRCEVKSRYSSKGIVIIKVVEEGIFVKPGDVLVELDSAEIEKESEEQRIALSTAKDAVTAAQNQALAAEQALKEYVEGTYIAELRTIDNEILLAKEEKRKAEDYFRHSQRLAAKNFITNDQLQADSFAVERAENALQLALTKQKVLQEVTRQKFMISLQSDLNVAISKLEAANESFAIEEKQLLEINEQIAKCKIVVPPGVSGQVNYANVFSRRGNAEFVMEPGATVREGQVLIRLPDRTKMQLAASVNESRITFIQEHLPTRIVVDALSGRELKGEVAKVNPYPEPEGWGGGGIKKYRVLIDIKDPPPEIRPGMNASAYIRIQDVDEAIVAPVQSLMGHGDAIYCLVQKGEQLWETRKVTVRANNGKEAWIESGLQPGEQVALNPAAYTDLLNLPQLENENDSPMERESELTSRSSQSKESAFVKTDKQSGDLATDANTRSPSPLVSTQGAIPSVSKDQNGVEGESQSTSKSHPAEAVSAVNNEDSNKQEIVKQEKEPEKSQPLAQPAVTTTNRDAS